MQYLYLQRSLVFLHVRENLLFDQSGELVAVDTLKKFLFVVRIIWSTFWKLWHVGCQGNEVAIFLQNMTKQWKCEGEFRVSIYTKNHTINIYRS